MRRVLLALAAAFCLLLPFASPGNTATVSVGNGSGPGPAGPTGPPGPAGTSGPPGTFTPAPSATGQIPYSANGSTFSLLGIGSSGNCIEALGSPLQPTYSGDCASLSANQTFTGNNIFNNTGGSNPPITTGTTGTYESNQIAISNGRMGFGDATIGSASSGFACAGAVNGELLTIAAFGDGILCVNHSGVIGIGASGESLNLSNIINTLSLFAGSSVDNDSTTQYPWTPGTAPSCTIGAGGTTCTTVAVNFPQGNNGTCTANPRGTAPPATPLIGETDVTARATSFQVTYTLSGPWTAGGTVAFNVVCH